MKMKKEELLLVSNVKGEMRSSEIFGLLNDYGVIPLSESTFYFEYPIENDQELKKIFSEVSSVLEDGEDFLICGVRTPSTGLMKNNDIAVNAFRRIGLWPPVNE
jgi:hypothetical protein